jgi:hypothetical protein
VRLEDAGVFGAHFGAEFALDFLDVLAGLDKGLFEPPDLLGQKAFRQFVLGDGGMRPSEYKNSAAAYPVGNRYATKDCLAFARGFWHAVFLQGAEELERSKFCFETVFCLLRAGLQFRMESFWRLFNDTKQALLDF